MKCKDYRKYGEAKLMLQKMGMDNTQRGNETRTHAEMREEKVRVGTKQKWTVTLK